MNLGERLRKAREDKGWTQVYVAKLFGMTSQALSNIERNQRDPDTTLLKKLAELYGVSIDWLMGITDTPELKPSHQPATTSTNDIIEKAFAELPKEEALQIENVLTQNTFYFDEKKLTKEDIDDLLLFLRTFIMSKKQ